MLNSRFNGMIKPWFIVYERQLEIRPFSQIDDDWKFLDLKIKIIMKYLHFASSFRIFLKN